MPSNGKCIPLNPDNPEHLRAVAELHARLLPESPIPRLGEHFMCEFYYSRLVRDGLIMADLYYYDDRYIAFSIYTHCPFTFMSQGLHRHFVLLCVVMLKTILMHPSRLKTIIDVLKLKSKQQSVTTDECVAEMLSFGILPEYGKVMDEASGLRVSNLLFERALYALHDKGCRKIRGGIRKDNLLSLLFWQSYGAVVKGVSEVYDTSCLAVIDIDKAIFNG